MIRYIAEQFQYPTLPALVDSVDGSDQFFGCEFFEIPKDTWQIILGTNNKVKMARHQTPRMDHQPFLLLAVAQRINDHMFQLEACE